jgi:hypothetical protein
MLITQPNIPTHSVPTPITIARTTIIILITIAARHILIAISTISPAPCSTRKNLDSPHQTSYPVDAKPGCRQATHTVIN